MQLSSKNPPPIRIAMLAFALSLVTTVQLAVAHGVFKLLLAGTNVGTIIFLLIATTAAAGVALIGALAALMRTREQHRLNAAVSSALAIDLALHLAAATTVFATPTEQLLAFAVSCLACILYAYGATALLLKQLRLSNTWMKLPARGAAVVVASAAIVAFLSRAGLVPQFGPIIGSLTIWRDAAVWVAVVSVNLAVVYSPGLSLDAKNRYRAWRLRLPQSQGNRLGVYLALAGATLSVVLQLAASQIPLDSVSDGSLWSSLVRLTDIPLSWIGLAYLTLVDLHRASLERQQGEMAANLTSTPARRLLRRHLSDQAVWAAAVGLRTANFCIDHDPSGQLTSELPATVLRLRNEEIQRCVTEVLGVKWFHGQVSSNRIAGALDPEIALRPGIDSLKLFACLYLDAGPLVERRITGLTALLPIVDPGLAAALRGKSSGSSRPITGVLSQHSQWFFYLDFGWIDQYVIHTPRSTRYDVQLVNLPERSHRALMERMTKTGVVGNYVWMGPEARLRLLHEAPMLASIIEPCPVTLANEPTTSGRNTGPDEQLMFVARFEQLIPRLQRFFDLDTTRQRLLDFEPSSDSLRLYTLFAMQLNGAPSETDVLRALKQIASVPWRGFREKDNALKLILSAHQRLMQLSPVNSPHGRAVSEAMRLELVETVRVIGYPSQVLHHAQAAKLALRDPHTLQIAASDPDNQRFAEAWLLLGTTDFTRYGASERLSLLRFLRGVGQMVGIAELKLPQAKAIDALAGLALANVDPVELSQVIESTYRWFMAYDSDLEIWSMLLDAQPFIALQTGQTGQPLELSAKLSADLDQYFKNKDATTLLERWQSIRGVPSEPDALAAS